MVLIFDLDDTLYDENAFVKSGFKAVARYVSGVTGISEKKLYLRELRLLALYGRGKIFNTLLEEHSVLTHKNVRKCLSIYRKHRPNIALYPGVRDLLKELSCYSRLYLVTEGNTLVQTAKIRALGIRHFFNKIYITNRYGPKAAKPALYCFEKIKRLEKCNWSDVVYIGDDPNKDFVALNRVGACTVRVHSGRFATTKAKQFHGARYNIKDIGKFTTSILS
ncbi:MAG: HAD family hydrolase [Minisyncoccia bacterium]|jgi:putative hydrolase of the HAD superfamily